jgi:hypothetical protein
LGFDFGGLKIGFGTGEVGRPGERLPQNLAFKPLWKLAAFYIFSKKLPKCAVKTKTGAA